MKRLIVFLAFSCTTILASQFYEGENLITPFQFDESNWELIKKEDTEKRSMMWADKELLFNDSYVVTTYPKRRESLAAIREIEDAPGKKACKSFNSIELPEINNKNYASIFWRTECETSSGFKAQIINLYIQGDDSLYSVQRIWRGPRAKPDADVWVSRMSKVYICDTRSKNKTCPSGFNKIKET
jgi:hypothetical protein